MTKPSLPQAAFTKETAIRNKRVRASNRIHKPRRCKENSDVLVSAVISSYLLTHLHHVLQRAEYGASKDGRASQAANFAELRKVLCMDARSMKDASAKGRKDSDNDLGKNQETNFQSKVA